MSRPVNRQLVAQLVIIAGACVGAWLLLIEPQARELEQLRVQIDVLQSSAKEPDGEQIRTMAHEIRRRVEVMQSRNALSSDSSQLYGRIMTLAREAGVSVQNVRPGSADRMHNAISPAKISRVEIVVDGTYQDVARFLAALSEVEGFLRPSSLTITPLSHEGQQLVTARIAYEAVEFAIPDALLALSEGGGHVKP